MQQADRFYCQFVFHGKRQCFSLGKVDPQEAEAKSAQADYLIMRLKQGLLQIPPGMDIVSFLQFDGKPPEQAAPRDAVTLKFLRDEYLKVHTSSLETTNTHGMGPHFKHLAGTLGEGFPVADAFAGRFAKARGPAGQDDMAGGEDQPCHNGRGLGRGNGHSITGEDLGCVSVSSWR